MPITSTYILGKVTFNSLVGWLLIIFSILQAFVPLKIIPMLYSLINFGLYIYAIVKYFVLRNKIHQASAEIEQFINTQPAYNSKHAFRQQKHNYQQMMEHQIKIEKERKINQTQNHSNGYNYVQKSQHTSNYRQNQHNYHQNQYSKNLQQPIKNELPSFSKPTLNSNKSNNNGQNNESV